MTCTLPASGNVTAIAHLDAAGTPTLTVFTNDTSALPAGQGRLVVRHTAAAPAVDVRASGAVAFANLSNPNEATADLPAGTISADVVPAGATEPVVIGPADLPITEGATPDRLRRRLARRRHAADPDRDHRRVGLGARQRRQRRHQPRVRRHLAAHGVADRRVRRGGRGHPVAGRRIVAARVVASDR